MGKQLKICYHAGLPFCENDDYDNLLAQIAERKFNCIRIDDGAGMLWDEQGKERGEILISQPFGKFTNYTTYNVVTAQKKINVLERVLRICRIAKKYSVQVILSSWFFLHTNWFLEKELKDSLVAMSTEEKIRYFFDELSRLLDVLRQENLIDIVAFVEIFNGFDGLPFAGEYKGVPAEEANELRILHEREIEKLKQRHSDVQVDLIPRHPRCRKK